LVVGLAAGCGGGSGTEGLVPVSGTISVDDQPTGNVVVAFVPQGTTGGHGGTGTTDATGRYEIVPPHGSAKALAPGQYKVTLSRRLNPDGSPPDPKTPPIESNARETLPTKYTDKEKTELTANLSAGDKRSFDFAVPSAKKK